MSAKVVLVFCAQALFAQFAISACAGRPNMGAGLAMTPRLGANSCAGPVLPAAVLPTPGCSGLGFNGIGYGNAGLGYGSGLGIEVIPTSGGAFPISTSSSISPTGLSIVSDNVFEGTLFVTGELPFASVVALEGVLPSAGAGGVSYSAGNGVTAIESIIPSAAAAVVPAFGVGIGAYGSGIGAFAPVTGIGAYAPVADIAPMSVLPGAGCSAPVVEVVAPITGC